MPALPELRADEIEMHVVLVRRPVALEVVQAGRPVGREPVELDGAQRERQRLVDADKRWWAGVGFARAPLGEAVP